MTLLASVDIGSNAIRLLVGKVSEGVVLRQRYERSVTRLACGLAEAGVLGTPYMENAIRVLKAFYSVISGYGIKRYKAVGTAALREAGNSGEFLKRALSEIGLAIEVISAEKEAELTAIGVLSSIRSEGDSLIVDIGGGSTEWIFCRHGNILCKGTVPVGVIKLSEKYVKSDPPSKDDIGRLERHLEGLSHKIKNNISGFIGTDTMFICTAGTASTIASIDLGLEEYDHEKLHGRGIPLERLRELSLMLAGLPIRERVRVRGLEPERADLIIPGIDFTIKLMEKFGFAKVIVSDCGLPEGVLIELSSGEVLD